MYTGKLFDVLYNMNNMFFENNASVVMLHSFISFHNNQQGTCQNMISNFYQHDDTTIILGKYKINVNVHQNNRNPHVSFQCISIEFNTSASKEQ